LTPNRTFLFHFRSTQNPLAANADRPAPGKTTCKCCTVPRNTAPFPLRIAHFPLQSPDFFAAKTSQSHSNFLTFNDGKGSYLLFWSKK
jgi:hypothetical protein